jgi:hypothetical protein
VWRAARGRFRHDQAVPVSRRLWSAAAALAAAAAVLGFVGWKVVDDVLDLDRCDGEDDHAIGVGSCARPLVGDDFAAGRATIDVYVRSSTSMGASLGYRYSNLTNEVRSLDWTKVAVIDPSGRVIPCWGDDSEIHYGISPGDTVDVYGGCDVGDLVVGTHRLVYEDETVDAVELGIATD